MRVSAYFLKLFLCLLIFVLTSQHAFAQYDYRPGYIIENENDTIYGLIEYGNQKTNAYTCYFKKDSLSEVRSLSPNHIRGYTIGDSRVYVTRRIEFGPAHDSVNIFLEYLLKGSVNLYFFYDYEGVEHLFVEKGDVLRELSNETSLKNIDGKNYKITSNQYKRMLWALTPESAKTKQKIEYTDFKPKAIISVLETYHNDVCDSVKCIVYQRKNDKLNDAKWQIKVGLSAAYGYNKIDLNNELKYIGETYYFNGRKPARVNSSNFAKAFDANTAQFQNHSFYPGVLINITHKWRTSFQAEFNYRTTRLSNSQLELNFTTFSFPLLVRVDLGHYDKTAPFINGGINLLGTKLTGKEYNLNYSYPGGEQGQNWQTSEIRMQDIHLLDALGLGTFLGAGMRHDFNNKHSINAEIRYNKWNSRGLDVLLDKNVYLSPILKERSWMLRFEYCYTL